MAETSDLLANIQARRHLEAVNFHILHGDGEIREAPGKLSLVWTDPVTDTQRFIAIKTAGDDQIMINGRLYAATEGGLRQGLRAYLSGFRYP